jgi:hypothetical protein
MIALTASSVSVFAVPFNSFDPRSMAMGGVGVAIGDPSTAPFFNPALLSAGDRRKKFAFDLPIIGARMYDPSNLRTELVNLQDKITALDPLITATTTSPSQTTLTAASNSVTAISNLLASLSDKPLQLEFGMATVASFPGKTLGVAMYGSAWGAVGATVEYTDAAMISAFTTEVTTCATKLSLGQLCTAGTYVSATGTVTNPTLTSKVHARGVLITETGVSLSHGFVSNDRRFSIGITPKMLRLHMYDASLTASAGSINGMTGNDYYAFYTAPNIDIGITKNFVGGFRTGLVVKNAITQTYEFKNAPTAGATPVANGSTLTIKPQVRVGMAYEIPLFTVAADLDLTKNDPAGLEDYSQYAGVGFEVGISDWTQLRAGYRANMISKAKDQVVSAGLGFSPRLPYFKPHFDFAITTSPNFFHEGFAGANDLGFSLRFGFNF